LAIHWDEDTQTLILGGNFSGYRVDLGKTAASSLSAWKWNDKAWENVKLDENLPLHAEVRALFQINKQVFALTHDSPIYPLEQIQE
jgi:hypothetical protein